MLPRQLLPEGRILNVGPVVFSVAQEQDRYALMSFHKRVRYQNDVLIVGTYADAVLQSGYYEKTWNEQTFHLDVVIVKAEIRGELVGFARFGAPSFSENPTEYPFQRLAPIRLHLGELHQLYLDESVRHRGIGGLLYRGAIERLRAAGYLDMFISTYQNNVSARRFYQKLGAKHYSDLVHHRAVLGQKYEVNVSTYIHKDLIDA